MDPYLQEIARLQKLYDEVETDEEVDLAGDSGSEADDCANLEYNSDSAESGDEETVVEPSTTSTRISSTDRLLYKSKDGTLWQKHVPRTSGRARTHNIISHLPGTKGEATRSKSYLECWSVFFNDEMLNSIVECTNIFISQVAQNYKDPSDARPIDLAELKAVIGLLYIMGMFKSGRQNSKDFWNTDGTGLEICLATMAHRRFVFLLRCLRFDNKHTRNERKLIDKFCPIRNLFDKFLENCKKSYTAGAYVTLDEMLFAFRGRCSFKVYIPSKPARYGLKVFALVDARTFYVLNLEVYLGKQPDGPFQTNNSASEIVKRMCIPIYNSGRNVTMDNWFTSYGVVKEMLERHRITIVGTIRKNKREIPAELTQAKGRPVRSSVFAFQQNVTIVSYCPKKSKIVLCISSFHNSDSIDVNIL